MTLGNLGCCGIKELQGLRDWDEDKLFHLLHQYSGFFPAAWICFNGRDDGRYVQTFREFLQREKLATWIVDLPKVVNPNSHNLLDIGMWQIDRLALQNWYTNRLGKQNNICNCRACAAAREYSERMNREREQLVARIAQARNQANQVPSVASIPWP